MNVIFYCFFLGILPYLSPTYCMAESPLEVSFHQLTHLATQPNEAKHLDGQVIKIRGFIYETKEGQFILAAQPDLKSCCVGAPNKLQEQLLLEGPLSEIPKQQFITLEGVFKIEEKQGYLYRLEQIKLFHPQTSSFPWISLGLFSLILGGLYFLIKMKR